MITREEQRKIRIYKRRYNLKCRNLSLLPIIYIHKSNKFIYGQCVIKGNVVAYSSSVKFKSSSKINESFKAGLVLGEKMKNSSLYNFIVDIGYSNMLSKRINSFINGIKEKVSKY